MREASSWQGSRILLTSAFYLSESRGGARESRGRETESSPLVREGGVACLPPGNKRRERKILGQREERETEREFVRQSGRQTDKPTDRQSLLVRHHD